MKNQYSELIKPTIPLRNCGQSENLIVSFQTLDVRDSGVQVSMVFNTWGTGLCLLKNADILPIITIRDTLYKRTLYSIFRWLRLDTPVVRSQADCTDTPCLLCKRYTMRSYETTVN